MSQEKLNKMTATQLETYLYSLDKEKEHEEAKRVRDYKARCNANMQKVRKREIAKISKVVEKEYITRLKIRDNLLDLLAEGKEIPKCIERLEVTEYMLYRVDLRKSEKVINKVSKKLDKRYKDIQNEIESKIHNFHMLESIEDIDYSEYNTDGDYLAKTKEQYRLEYTEEERNSLIKKELDMIDQAVQFNSVPIPHEILKNSDRDIQSKMPKFNSIRQKRIRILSTMKQDYEKLLDPRELLSVIDDALSNLKTVEDILTKSEYNSVKNALIGRKRRVNRSTNEIRTIIETKEKKTGILSFNIQQARYLRMEHLRNTILEATSLIRENPIEETEEQLEKLKISYEREKQFASVIENLNNGRGGNVNTEVRVYEEQIKTTEYKLLNSKKIVREQKERIVNAKKELLILWKMEINSAVSKKKDMLELPGTKGTKENRQGSRRADYSKRAFLKLGKSSRGKHAALN